MSTKIKLYLGHKVVDCLKGKLKVSPAELKPYIQVGSESEKYVQMHLPAAALENSFNVPNAAQLLAIEPDDIIGKVHCIQEQKTKTICFEINKNLFIKDIIENCALPYINFHPKHVVVEFSSPNVAKPFHLGHLRSTIIGNFVANLYDYFHNNVTKLNYLGDWGTQFGFIKVGMEELKYTKEDLKRNPIKMLYQSYVHANKLGETDPEILKRARNEFSRLENGPPETLSDWKAIMDFTKEELERTYERLGVSFTEYHMESMYNIKDIQNVIDRLTEKDVLQAQDGGKKVAVVNDRQVPLVKSDGSSLYLTRDVAAAIDRFDKYKFDRMFYLADNSQHDHFANLKLILQKLDLPFANRIQHVKFGRVRGMSSRRGNAVFLKDILDECRELVVQKQIQSPTTRVSVTDDLEISDTLGVSCVVINDLKQRRLRDYEFSWDRVLQSQGDTGIKLQYTHCRLCSLAEHCCVTAAEECLPEALQEKEATNLIREIARFHDVLYVAQEHLEACVLVTYLFHLCNHINKALKRLKVKGMEGDTAAQRLLLFNSARAVLKEGMTILGLKPLTKM